MRITFDRFGESRAFTSPHYSAPVFFRASALGYVLAYVSDGSPTNGNRYESFPSKRACSDFAREHRFTRAQGET